MIPPYRRGEDPPARHSPRNAAVLILLHEGDGATSFPLILRSPSLARHGGQMALPGGSLEPGEEAVDAAFREAGEEIGADPARLELLGALSVLELLPSGFTVQPFVAWTASASFTPDGVEAIGCFPVDIAELLDPGARISVERDYGGETWLVPALRLGGQEVWGATAMILAEFAAVLASLRP